MTLLSQFRSARRVSAPVIAIQTPDQWAVVQMIKASFKEAPPLVTWDLGRGMTPLNQEGLQAVNNLGVEVEPIMLTNPGEALSQALKFPDRTILFCFNFHRVIGEAVVSQSVWNTREAFKSNGRSLVLLAPDITLPAELASDVLVLDDPLPTEEQLQEIIMAQFDAAAIDVPSDEVFTQAIDAVSGLAAFPAEQVVCMSLSAKGLDLQGLWERKRQSIEQTPGLSVYRGGDTFDDIAGIANAKQFGRQVLSGQSPPRAIVFIDEIEKAMGGTQGDTSGVSQEMLGTLLTWMQDKAVTGLIAVGPPGAAKSAYAKALGNTAGIPTISFDLSGMKGSLVGESGRNLRTALKVVDAVSQGRALVVATCNSIADLPPELRRRFNFGTFFFDLPTAEERAAIWALYMKKYELKKQAGPSDDSWTGAEIKMCCELAWRLNITLQEASAYVVPVAKSAGEKIAKLRESASGRFISASAPGVYNHAAATFDAPVKGRKFAQEA